MATATPSPTLQNGGDAAPAAPHSSAPWPDDSLYEVVDGKPVENPPMGVYEVWVAGRLLRWFNRSDASDRAGQAVMEVLFSLDSTQRLKRRPDLAFITHARWPGDRPAPEGEAWDVIPDLTVEVVSPTNTMAEVHGKVDEYFRAGVRLVWVILPKKRVVYVYRSIADVRILQPGDDLDGGDVIPGFRVPLAGLFGEPDAPAAG